MVRTWTYLSLMLDFGLDLFLADDMLGGAGIGGDWGSVWCQYVPALTLRTFPRLTIPGILGWPIRLACQIIVSTSRGWSLSPLIDQGLVQVPEPHTANNVHDTSNWSEAFTAFWPPNDDKTIGHGL